MAAEWTVGTPTTVRCGSRHVITQLPVLSRRRNTHLTAPPRDVGRVECHHPLPGEPTA